MTNNEDLKKDTEELWKVLSKYKRKWRHVFGKAQNADIQHTEDHLELILIIVSTDTENAIRDGVKSLC